MATDKWWVTSDVELPEEVGHGLCACDYVLALHMITFPPQQPHIYDLTQENLFSWILNASGASNILPVEHASSFSSCFSSISAA